MRIIYTFILLLEVTFFSFLLKAENSVRLIPQPAEIRMYSGTLRLPGSVGISYSPILNKEATLLSKYLQESELTTELHPGKPSAMIQLQISPTVLPAYKEGYVLQISDRNIQIKSSSSTGIFYGIQTLRQLIGKYPDRQLPQLTITDYPNFSWRAFMLDEARYLKGKEVVWLLLDKMDYL